MSSPSHTVTDKVMSQIQSGTVRMRPHWQFVLVAVFGAIGLFTAAIVSIFLVNLVVFKLRRVAADQPIYAAEAAAGYYTHHFPWLAFLIATVSFSLLVCLLRTFDFSYHAGRWLIVAFALVSMGAGTAAAFTSLDTHLENIGPLREMYGNRAPASQQSAREKNQKNNGSLKRNGSSNSLHHFTQK